MYKAKLDKTFYIVGEIHGERCIDSYSHLIPECDSLLLEADPNNASIYNLLDYDPEPLENRVSKSVIHLIMDYVDFEDVRYKTLESVLHLIFFTILVGVPKDVEADEEQLWNRFETKDILESNEEHSLRAKEGLKLISNFTTSLIDSNLEGLSDFIDGIVGIKEIVKNMDKEDICKLNLDQYVYLNDDRMVDKIHSYKDGKTTLVVTGIGHTQGIISGLEKLGYTIEKL